MADPVREAALVPGCPEHVALWDAINAYSAACGGHPTRGGGARMDAVVRVEAALRAALAATDGAIPTASRGGANDAEAGRRVRNTPDVARAIGSLVDAWDLSDEDSAVEKLRGPMNALRKLIDDDALYALPLPPASAGEVETARRARRLAQDAVIRALNAVGVRASNADDFAEIVGSSVDAAERAERGAKGG